MLMLQSRQNLVRQTIQGPASDFLNHSLMMHQLIELLDTPSYTIIYRKKTLVLQLLMKRFAYFQACYCLLDSMSFQTIKCTGRRPLPLSNTFKTTISDSMPRDTFERIPRNLKLWDNSQLGKQGKPSRIVLVINELNKIYFPLSAGRTNASMNL